MDSFLETSSSALNRSLSAPDLSVPVRRRILIEEVYQHEFRGPLIRKFSCEQIYNYKDYHHSDSLLSRMQPLNVIDHVPKNTSAKKLKRGLNLIEPMDVDSDASSFEVVTKEDFGDPACASTPPMPELNLTQKKKKPRSLIQKSLQSQANRLRRPNDRLYFNMQIPFLILGIWIFFCQYYYLHIDQKLFVKSVNITKLEYDFNTGVINQYHQTNKIINTITNLNKNRLNIMTLIGTTGVGKTLCANIMKRNFNKNQIFDININTDRFENLSFMKNNIPNLIIIDNLQYSDTDKVIGFLDNLPNKYEYIYIIVAIFNIQDTENGDKYIIHNEHFSEIPKKFESSKYSVDHIAFNPLNKNIIKDYFVKILAKLKYRSDIHDSILEVIEEHDVHKFGFKGLNAKINLVVEKIEA